MARGEAEEGWEGVEEVRVGTKTGKRREKKKARVMKDWRAMSGVGGVEGEGRGGEEEEEVVGTERKVQVGGGEGAAGARESKSIRIEHLHSSA